jgi:ribosomal protein S18 acetylase RimI-like enzyme
LKVTLENDEQVVVFKHITEEKLIEGIRQLFLEYAHSLQVDLSFQNFQEELKTLPGKYVLPHGILVLALVDGKEAGCVALHKISDSICEMKRLYVRDDYRGLGIGKKLISIIIEEAIKMKYQFIRLDTLPTMKSAQALYTSIGFYDIDPYVYNPVEGARFMELELKSLE